MTFSIRPALPRRLPLWSVIVFSVAFAFALSPNLVNVFGIMNDYEMLIFKNHGFWFHEASDLFAIARPLSALLANLTLLPAETIADFRWTRLFSVLTVCFLGFQAMSICVHRLRTDVLPAMVIALTTFLAPAFIYSVLDAPAWGVHLVPVLLAFFAYEVLSNSNVQAIGFTSAVQSRSLRVLWWQLLAYCRRSSVWGACIVLQLAFYDFPPNALVIIAFPVAILLFSKAPLLYRAIIAIRDISFVVANLAIYIVSVKAVYLPILAFLNFYGSEAWLKSHTGTYDERMGSGYNYKFNLDPEAVLGRLRDVSRVSGDLWFLPQTQAHVVVGLLVVMALAVLTARWLRTGTRDRSELYFGLLAALLTLGCFLIAGAAALVAGKGFVSYRTAPVCTVIVGIVLLFALVSLVRVLSAAIGWSLAIGGALVSAMLLITAAAAVAGNFEMNYLTMRLARNETAYFNKIVRQAIENHSRAIIIVDPRPFTLPEDHPLVYDESGRAIPPYELSCLSGFCMQSGAIVTILAEQQGVSRSRLDVYPIRNGEPVPNASCEMFTGPPPIIPAGTSDNVVEAIKYLRRLTPLTCVTYSLDWHNVDVAP